MRVISFGLSRITHTYHCWLSSFVSTPASVITIVVLIVHHQIYRRSYLSHFPSLRPTPSIHPSTHLSIHDQFSESSPLSNFPLFFLLCKIFNCLAACHTLKFMKKRERKERKEFSPSIFLSLLPAAVSCCRMEENRPPL